MVITTAMYKMAAEMDPTSNSQIPQGTSRMLSVLPFENEDCFNQFLIIVIRHPSELSLGSVRYSDDDRVERDSGHSQEPER